MPIMKKSGIDGDRVVSKRLRRIRTPIANSRGGPIVSCIQVVVSAVSVVVGDDIA